MTGWIEEEDGKQRSYRARSHLSLSAAMSEIARVRERISQLKQEVDDTAARAEAAEAKNKTFEQEILQKDHEISSLSRKVGELEAELEDAEKKAKEAIEAHRQLDIKLEHTEKQMTRLEQERDEWEQKYEAMKAQYDKSKHDLEALERDLGGL